MAGSSPHSAATMNATTRKLLEKVRRIVPPMLERFHKGIDLFSFNLCICPRFDVRVSQMADADGYRLLTRRIQDSWAGLRLLEGV
jgi:hypothetical protein